jgi:nicotinamidase-related amidase
MATLPSDETVLLVIDVQQAFHMPPYTKLARSTPDFEENLAMLLDAFRNAQRPIVHVHHHSTSDSSPFHPTKSPLGILPQVIAQPLDNELVIVKRVNSGFIGTSLEKLLRQRGWNVLIVVGLTTSHCISTTVRMAGNLGFQVFVPRDATAMFERSAAPGSKIKYFRADTMHDVALTELHEEFATIVTTADVLSSLRLYHEN